MDIESVYKKYNRPAGVERLFKLAKDEGLQATRKDIKKFLDSKIGVQQLKETKTNVKSRMGHIVSFNPFNLLQLDIFVMLKYEKYNKGYKYIFCVIDVFSRKVWCYPMKKKSLVDTTKALKTFFEDANIKSFNKDNLSVIMSDSDSAFKGDERVDEQNFQKVMTDNNAVLEQVKLNDHSALGVIDRFAKTLKIILTTEFIESGKANWTEILPIIIKGYNNTPHGGLNGIKPNDVFTDEQKRIEVLHLNTEKSRHSNTASKSVQSDLKKDDKVRVRDTAMFKKGTEARWTDEIFIVESTKGKSVTLTDGRSLKREDVLPIPKHTIPITHINIVKLATKERKQVIQLHQEGVDESNIINQPRQRKPINYKA